MAGMAGFGTRPRRYLCSQLVTLRWSGRSRLVNLEEICRTGAWIESDEPVGPGTRVEMRVESARFHGTVTDVEEHELGWRLTLEFSPMTPWTLESFQPEHLLDPSTLE
jgi:hypothetical protein